MEKDAGLALPELRVDGGATANNLLMQFQADLLGVPVVRPRVLETTALGAAYLAGLAVGYWKDASDVEGQLAGRPHVRAVDGARAGRRDAVALGEGGRAGEGVGVVERQTAIRARTSFASISAAGPLAITLPRLITA